MKAGSSRRRWSLAILAVALALPAVPATAARAAPAGGADTITARGACGGGAAWSLSARAAGRGIQVTAKVQSAPGVRWRVAGSHNGSRVVSAVVTTNRRGVVVLRRHTANRPGIDTYQLVAVRKGTRIVCRGALSY